MISFRQIVLAQIKSASNEKEIEAVIGQSIQRLKIKNVNGHIIQRFVLNMGSSLQQAKAEPASEKTMHNMSLAIDLFKTLQKGGR